MIAKFLIYFVAIGISAWFIPGVRVDSLWALAATAAVLGLINTFIRPLVTLLSLPFVVLTGGLLLIVINALMIMLASHLLDGFSVDGFLTACMMTLVIFLVWLFTK